MPNAPCFLLLLVVMRHPTHRGHWILTSSSNSFSAVPLYCATGCFQLWLRLVPTSLRFVSCNARRFRWSGLLWGFSPPLLHFGLSLIYLCISLQLQKLRREGESRLQRKSISCERTGVAPVDIISLIVRRNSLAGRTSASLMFSCLQTRS